MGWREIRLDRLGYDRSNGARIREMSKETIVFVGDGRHVSIPIEERGGKALVYTPNGFDNPFIAKGRFKLRIEGDNIRMFRVTEDE
jgi:hypothetical protein